MHDGVNLAIPGRFVLPGAGKHRDDLLEGAWLRCRYSFSAPADLEELTDTPLHRALAHCPEFVGCPLGVLPHTIPHENVDVLADNRIQEFAAYLIPGKPYILKSGIYIRSICEA